MSATHEWIVRTSSLEILGLGAFAAIGVYIAAWLIVGNGERTMSATDEIIDVTIRANVRIRITDEAPADLFTRMESGDLPDALYGSMTRDDVIAHWCYNATANGADGASQLDGWADVPWRAVTFDVSDVEVER